MRCWPTHGCIQNPGSESPRLDVCEINCPLWGTSNYLKWQKVKVAQWCLTLWDPRNSPGYNTGVDSLSLLQGIFPTQGSNPGLLHCRQILYQLRHKGSLQMAERVLQTLTCLTSPDQLMDPALCPVDRDELEKCSSFSQRTIEVPSMSETFFFFWVACIRTAMCSRQNSIYADDDTSWARLATMVT